MHLAKKISFLLVISLLLVIPLVSVVAYNPTVPGSATAKVLDVKNLTDVGALSKNIAGILQFVLFAIAGIFIVIAGYIYLTAQGETDKTVNSRNMIFFAVVAIMIGLLAFFLPNLVTEVLKSG
jgi:cytochrome bd-type quinol oxidase subunit 2